MPYSDGHSVQRLLAEADWIRALAGALVDHPDEADDAVQDVWAAALDRPPASDGSVRAWLAQVTRNAVRKRWRGEMRRRAREEDAARDEALPSTLDVVERFSTQQAVGRAVLELEEPFRRTLLMRYYEDLTLREIAERSGVAISTVDWRLRRGLDQVRARLERDAGGDRRGLTLALVALARPPRVGLVNGGATALVGALAAVVVAVTSIGIASRGAAPIDSLPDPDVALARPSVPAPEGASPRGGRRAHSLGDTEAAPRESACALVVRVAVDRGTMVPAWPLSDTPLRLVPDVTASEARSDRVRRTALDGTVRFNGLRPGTYTVESPLGASGRIEVNAGAEGSLELRVPGGSPLSGVVVDGAGRPVAGASIWLAPDGAESWIGGSAVTAVVDDAPVATSDATGRFALPTVGRARAIGAYAPGRSPSLAMDLGDPFGCVEHEVTLVLDGAGCTVVGRVVDGDGRPMAGARVVLDAFGRDAGTRVDAPLLRTRTDAEGRYRFDGARPAQRHVVVRVSGLALSRVPVELIAGGTCVADVVVETGARVEGVVRDAAGAPVAGALVYGARRRWNAPPGERFSVATRTDHLGRYVLEGLRPGALWVTADAGAGGSTQELLPERVDSLARVDLVLESGAAIVGRVVDGDGCPVAGVTVECVPDGAWIAQLRTTGADGRFRFDGCADVTHGLRVRENQTLVARRRAAPGDDEVEVVLDAAARPSSELRGTLVDAAGDPVVARELVLTDTSTGRPVSVPARALEGGAFVAGPLRAGTFSVEVVSVDQPTYRLERPVDLVRGRPRDIGLVELPPRGWVRIALAGGDTDELVDARVRVVDADARVVCAWSAAVPSARAPFAAALRSGEYRVVASARGRVPAVVPVRVESEGVARVTVDLAAGVPVRFEWDESSRGAARLAYRVTVSDEAGLPLLDVRFERGARGPAALDGLALEPGSYTFALFASDGARTVGAFDVPQGDASPVVVRCALPSPSPRPYRALAPSGVPR